MKNLKKVLAFVLVAMMVLSFSATAFADDPAAPQSSTVPVSETATVTVNKPETAQVDTGNTGNETYTAYLILNATETDALLDKTPLEPGDSGITYYTDATKADLLGTYFTFADGKVGDSAVKVVTATTLVESGSQAQAQGLLTIAKANGFTSTVLTANADGSSFSANLPIGYYVIESSLGSCVVALTTDMTVEQKNQYPTFTKALTNNNDAYVAIGDTVEYTIVVTVPKSVNQDIVIHDTLDAGLTYNNDAVGATAAVDGQNITFTIPATAAGTEVTITYSAHVEETVTYTGEYKNSAYLTYSEYQSVKIDVVSKTNKVELLKYDGADNNKANLAGAVFELQLNGVAVTLVGSGSSYRVADEGETGVTQFTTVEGQNIVIDGVDSDLTYQFVEISAPEGYNKLNDDQIPSTQPAVDNSTVVEVANMTGTVLPSTGGIGTTIFYIVGGLLVIGAAVVLVAKKRVSE